MTIIIGYSRKIDDDFIESYIAHDSMRSTMSGNRLDIHYIPEKGRRLSPVTLAAFAGQSTHGDMKAQALSKKLQEFKEDPQRTLKDINKTLFGYLDEDEKKGHYDRTEGMIIHDGVLSRWARDKISPHLPSLINAIDFIGSGSDVAKGAHITTQHLRTSNYFKSSHVKSVDIDTDPISYLKYLVSVACYGNTSCGGPIWIHSASTKDHTIITQMFK